MSKKEAKSPEPGSGGEQGAGRPEISRLIPHRPPILMVEEVVEAGDGELVCRGTVPPSPGTGNASPFLALEMAAQTAAVMAALEEHGAAADGRPAEGAVSGDEAPGFLAAVRDARFLQPEIPGGRPLLAAVRRTRRMPPFAMYAVRIATEDGSEDLITATLTTYRAP